MNEQPPSHEQRRRFARVLFNTEAYLLQGEARLACEVIDLSLRGALLRCADAPLSGGAPVSLELRLGSDAAVIAMHGSIAHRDGNRLGIRCSDIDLDSITHLRRVVELNSGDASLLDRELAALIAGR